jgi:thiol-disulfide isomerase/thioredoxin
MSWMALLTAAMLVQGSDPETRVVEYLKANVAPGKRVVVSQLYNEVFTAPEERAVLDRLFNTFFKIPLYVAQYQQSAGRPPTLAELSEQFSFSVPGETDVILKIMQSDPRMPAFLERDPGTGEITRVDVEAILAHPRFGKLLERSLAGWMGRPAPSFSLEAVDGSRIGTEGLAGKGYLLYFWFTGCPPCLKTTPLLVELYPEYAKRGFEIVAANADRVLELPYGDDQRAAYVEKTGIEFRVAHLTPEVQAAFGAVSIFPTLFFVDGNGTIVEHAVNFQEREVLEAAIQKTLE